jgi:hypothetical protein
MTESVRRTFGYEVSEVEDFEDKRRRIGEPDVCVWLSFENYEKLRKQTL